MAQAPLSPSLRRALLRFLLSTAVVVAGMVALANL
jgi:hypothetical protein